MAVIPDEGNIVTVDPRSSEFRYVLHWEMLTPQSLPTCPILIFAFQKPSERKDLELKRAKSDLLNSPAEGGVGGGPLAC
jgi:hypothetical protein